jgi:hypothetical protein
MSSQAVKFAHALFMVRFGWFLVQPEINFLVRGGLVFHGLLAAFGSRPVRAGLAGLSV